ncbi:Transposase [Methanocella conradii HZ254]|uniref:Transposase n=1 Tax=Methanocella conradii (strain DSM 24694 / JCM 17849 / CGMCC 1.5162 / HZ254) TaxID=1041930 RepID=H8I8G5_METCZ|nr:Transposase [Methanocella conradii HZ254]
MKQEHWISARGCVYNINYHMVWSTKYRRKVLDGAVRDRLIKLHEEIAKEKGIILQGQEVMPDHVHLIITAHPKYPPATIVKIFKGITAKVLFEEHQELRTKLHRGHLWNPSYYCGTMGDVTEDVIERYVEMQKTKGL